MFEIAVIYLAAAIIAVPIAKRLGLGSVLYLNWTLCFISGG